jgi:hypothetical protein
MIKSKNIFPFFLVVTLIFLSVGKIYPQEISGNNITISPENKPLREVLKDISNQTQIKFVYSDELVNNVLVTCDVKNVPISTAMKKLLKSTNISYKTISSEALITLYERLSVKSTSKISGKIVDLNTGNPIPNVNLFFSYTTIGTITNKDGKYLITNIPAGQYSLIVSHIGYEIKSIPLKFLTPVSLVLNIELEPRILKGKEVQVETTTPEEWKKNLKTFKLLFIGKTKNSKKCKILNPEVINFELNSETNKFIAFTDSLIYLSNEALGYRIEMILDFFTLNLKTNILKYQVYPKFELMKYQKEKEFKKWKKNRKTTYEGSFRHFISSLALGKLKEDKFQVYQYGYVDTSKKTWIVGSPQKIKNYKDVLLSPDSLDLQNFHFDNFLYCDYKRRYTSWLELLTDDVQIDTLGNCYDELKLLKRGFWGKARMADVLPFDYEPNKN